MPFPDVKRVVYENNPLDKVICQLRFPQILRIENELPANFQERIISRFPVYQEKTEFFQQIVQPVEGQGFPDVLQQMVKNTTTKNHEFLNDDESLTVNLTRTFIALTSTKYVNWEDFLETFNYILKVLTDIYKPAFYTRVGLRYIDVIIRSNLKLAEKSWEELLEPHILGLLSSPVKNSVLSNQSITEINLADEISKVKITTSLVTKPDNNEKCFMIDSDFFTQKRTKITDLESKLDFLHYRATRLIQWLIKDELHRAMNPKEI